jgi:hypothetical protein
VHLDLSDEETATRVREIHDIIESDKFPFSPRVRSLRAILGNLGRSRCGSPYGHRRSMRRRGSFAEGAAAGEILPWTASHTRQHGESSSPVDRLVQGLPTPGRARPGRDGGALRCRNYRTGLGRKAGLRPVRQPTCQHGGERDPLAATTRTPQGQLSTHSGHSSGRASWGADAPQPTFVSGRKIDRRNAGSGHSIERPVSSTPSVRQLLSNKPFLCWSNRTRAIPNGPRY